MSGAREIKPSLECTEWDFVRQIDVYRNANWSTGLPNDEIDGLKVMTLMDEEVTFGDCQGIMHSIVMEKDVSRRLLPRFRITVRFERSYELMLTILISIRLDCPQMGF